MHGHPISGQSLDQSASLLQAVDEPSYRHDASTFSVRPIEERPPYGRGRLGGPDLFVVVTVRLGIVNRTPGGDEDMTAGPIGRHRVAVAGVWD